MRALLSTVCTAAVVGGLVVGATAPATAAATLHRPGKISISSSSVAEDAARGTVVGQLSAYDPDAGYQHTFSFVDGKGDADNGLFKIRGTRLVVAGALDYETEPELSVRVRVTDRTGRWREARLPIEVRDVADQPPTDLKLAGASVDENQPAGTVVGTLTTIDPNKTTRAYSYRILGGANAASAFAIAGNKLVTAAPLDHEAAATRSVRVQAVAGADSIEKDFTVAVADVNEAPTDITLSPDSVVEGEAGAAVGTLSAVDPDARDTATFAFVSGAGDTDNDLFSIDGATLRTATALDYETRTTYSVLVRATDASGATFRKALTVNVTDVAEGVYNLRLSHDSFDENVPDGTVVGIATADGNGVTYSIVGCAPSRALLRGCRTPAVRFSISSSGVLTTRYSGLDYEESSHSFPVTIKATDASGSSIQDTFTLHLNDVNEAPTDILLDDPSSAEVHTGWNLVGDLSSVDQDADDTATFSIVGAVDADELPVADGAFDVWGCGGPRLWAQTDVLSVGDYTVTVRVTDAAGLFYDEDFTVSIVPPAPPVAPHRIVAARRC